MNSRACHAIIEVLSRWMMRVRRRNSVLEALEIVRGNYPEIGLTGILVLLYVAENPGINIAEVADICGLTDATASRTVRALTAPDSEGALPPSLGLLQIFPNPGDARGRVLFLSAEGKRLCRSLDDAIARANPIDQLA